MKFQRRSRVRSTSRSKSKEKSIKKDEKKDIKVEDEPFDPTNLDKVSSLIKLITTSFMFHLFLKYLNCTLQAKSIF